MPPRSSARTRAAVPALLALLVALGACSDGDAPRPAPTITEDNGVSALGRAIDAVNTSRGALLTDTGAVVAAARSLDAGDAAAAVGDRATMQTLRTDIEARHAAAAAAVGRLAARLTAYDTALSSLDAAAVAPALDAAQRGAVTDVVRAGRTEHAALTAFAQVTRTSWPRYAALHADGSLWFTRARGGWYRNTEESANAYAVMVSDERDALDAARAALQRADATRARAVAAMSASITAARTALVDLVDVARSPSLGG